jgi:hypothetical protein
LRRTPGINADKAAASLRYRRSALFHRPIRVIVIMAGDCPVILFALFALVLFVSLLPRGVMAANDVQIDFNAPAVLKKWPSLNSERFQQARHPDAYLLVDGTLDECIREFMTKPASQRHLYEIHTAPQQPLVSAVLSPEHIVEIARLRDFLC